MPFRVIMSRRIDDIRSHNVKVICTGSGGVIVDFFPTVILVDLGEAGGEVPEKNFIVAIINVVL